jgi:hypothetical protein
MPYGIGSKCVFELSKFSYDTMQLSTVTGNLESRDASISRDIRRYKQNSSLLDVPQEMFVIDITDNFETNIVMSLEIEASRDSRFPVTVLSCMVS